MQGQKAGPGPGSISFMEFYDTKLQSEVFCRCIATGLLDTALDRMDFTKPDKHWIQQKDNNRKSNKGAAKRISRTWQFKKNTIHVLEMEKMVAMHPDDAAQASTFIATIYNIARSQINTWNRSRTTIFKNVKGIKRNNTKAYNLAAKGATPSL